jgi:hypothetical protein
LKFDKFKSWEVVNPGRIVEIAVDTRTRWDTNSIFKPQKERYRERPIRNYNLIVRYK